MYPAESPEQLYKLISDFVKNKGCEGVLISGGANINGSIPFLNYLKAMKKIKDDFGIIIIIHSGLITNTLAEALIQINIDAVMLDVIGDDETIHQVYHLNKSIENYEESLKNLSDFKIPFVPHVLFGLDYGKIKGELLALKMIKKYKPQALVLVALMPLEGTPMRNIKPVSPKILARYFTLARLMFPKIPVMLGCGRPKGDHKVETDILAVQSGINGIAYPSQEAANYSIKHSFELKFSELCCSLVYREIIK
jgi:uncharacterized radical SAM superfamily protein